MNTTGNLASVIKSINKEMGSDVLTFGVQHTKLRKVPMSSPKVNWMLYGGIPLNRVIELCGPDAGGKTTTALDFVKNYQMLPDAKTVLYVDHEHTLEEFWATLIGVDVEHMLLYRPETESAEDVFDKIIELIETNEIGAVVIDSIASLVPKSEINEGMENHAYGGIAKVLTKLVNKIVPLLVKYSCTLIGINQVRDDMNSQYNLYKTPGGRAWKHACSLRIMCSKGSLVDDNGEEIKASSENPAGNQVMLRALKLKGIVPNRLKGFYTLNYTTGIDYVTDTINMAIDLNLIQKRGGWYYFVDVETGEVTENKVQGFTNLRKYLATNSQLFNDIYGKVNAIVSSEDEE